MVLPLLEIGFTGTRRGMSFFQKKMFRWIFAGLSATNVIIFHHGDAKGADAEADAIAREFGARIVIHPPSDPKYRAYCFQEGDLQFPEKPYGVRDKDIVNPADLLIATPQTWDEYLRSGTWMTVRYARKSDKPRIILEP